jgi:tRNA(Ile)-lysidine synthase
VATGRTLHENPHFRSQAIREDVLQMSRILFEKFMRTIHRHRLFSPGDRILLAVSGGADSVAMLQLLHEIARHFQIQLAVAHFNHHLRGRESEEDEEFVKRLAESRQLDFFRGEDAAGTLARSVGNLEERAREQRYAFLSMAAQQTQAQKIALGHTLDDQAETFLMRFLRGSGSTGLSGIPFARDGIWIRPLLEINRQEILEFLQARNLNWREDSSNNSGAFLRNRIRHHLLPLLEQEYNPRVRTILAQTADILRDESEALKKMAAEYVGQKSVQEQRLELPVEEMNAFPTGMQSQILREALLQYGPRATYPPAHHIRAILELLAPGKGRKKFQTEDWLVTRKGRFLVITPKRTGSHPLNHSKK